MILGIDQLGARLKAHYDKVIAFFVLLLLVSSLIYLGVRVGLIRQMQADFDLSISSFRAANPNADQIDSTAFKDAISSMETPLEISLDATNSYMFVPGTRFSCRDCRLPVPMDAKKCPHCEAVVELPEEVNLDADGDGMLTEWELRYNLDPYDPSDANKDNDADGYSNLLESKQGFDPTDASSHPAAVEQLRLNKITGEKFDLQFKSRIKTRSGYKFGLNYRLPTGETKTDFVAIGAIVADVEIISYKEILVKAKSAVGKITRDDSELTVKTKDGDLIVLTKNKPAQHVKLTAHMILRLADGSERKIDVAKNDEFEIEGAKYKVIDIDGGKSRVIIQGLIDKKKIVIQHESKQGRGI